MKIVGVTLCRNEEWVIGASVRAALKWVDALYVLMHECTDRTFPILLRILGEVGPKRLVIAKVGGGGHWNEMDLRQHTLDAARKMGATHVAIIDADEIPTANIVPLLRNWVSDLKPRQLLDLPMIAPWRGMTHYRDDSSIWSGVRITTAFMDDPSLCWKAAEDGYQYHARAPRGSITPTSDRLTPIADKAHGGIMHLQWVDWERLKIKHVHYRLSERARWPEREPVEKVNRRYDMALDEVGIKLSPMKPEWLDPDIPAIVSGIVPWHLADAKRLYGDGTNPAFRGLDLKGVL